MPASYGGSSGPITAAAIAAVLVAAFALLSGGERAATLGLTRHGQLVTAQDAGAADAVAAVAVTPGTAGQVLTVSDAGLPHWAAAASGGASSVDYDFSSTTGWTLSGLDGATVAFASNLATFTVPSGIHLATPSRPRATIPLATVGVASPWRVAAEARLAAFDATGLRRAAIVLSSTSNGLDATLYGSSDVGVLLLLVESAITVYDLTGGVTSTLRVSSNRTAALDGQDWFRFELRGPDVLVYYGHGATRPATGAWSLIASCTAGGTSTYLVMAPIAYLTLGAYRSDTTASEFTASWADLRVTDLP